MRSSFLYVGFVAIWIVIFIPNLCILSYAGSEFTCNDITSVDFKSLRMTIEGRGTVQLENGKGYTSDAGEEGVSKDWEIILKQDNTLHPMPPIDLRLIKIFASHITGSGSWSYVYLYQCRNGRLDRIFNEEFPGDPEIKIITDREFQITSVEWMKDDPMANPSKERISIYRWTPYKETFLLVKSTLHAMPENK